MSEKHYELQIPVPPENWRELVVEELHKWKPRHSDQKFEIRHDDDMSVTFVWRTKPNGKDAQYQYTVVWGFYLNQPLVSCDQQYSNADEALNALAMRMSD